MSRLSRLADIAFRRRRLVLAGWLAGLIAILALGNALRGEWSADYATPGSESKAAVEVATGGMDVDRIKMERKAREIQAQSILSEFEVEMGLKKADAVKEAAPFPEAAPGQRGAQKLPEA